MAHPPPNSPSIVRKRAIQGLPPSSGSPVAQAQGRLCSRDKIITHEWQQHGAAILECNLHFTIQKCQAGQWRTKQAIHIHVHNQTAQTCLGAVCAEWKNPSLLTMPGKQELEMKNMQKTHESTHKQK